MAEGYRIRVATLQDRALLDDWRRQPHVQEWWGPPEPFTEVDFAEPGVVLSIVECDGVPFAFIQDYDVHAWPNHHFGYLPAGSRGIDQFIARPGCWAGARQRFIRQRAHELFAAGAPVVATDPHPKNAPRHRACRKAGFRIVGPEEETAWGRVIRMEAERSRPVP